MTVLPPSRSAISLAAFAFGLAAPLAGQRARPVPPTNAAPLRFEWVGPEPAGRISAVAGVAGDTSTYYFGAASGGIWKTTDAARTFAPIFD
ncbi:MAG: hypothetical protein AB7L66_20215, partial [Gemmatimonadales bacterium]